jgi:hypothetical protein
MQKRDTAPRRQAAAGGGASGSREMLRPKNDNSVSASPTVLLQE